MDKIKPRDIWKPPFHFHGLSLQQRIPLLICILLLCEMVTFSWISYEGVKRAAIKTSQERLLTLTSQLSLLFNQSTQNLLTVTRTTANQPVIKEFFRSHGQKQTNSTLLALAKIRQDSTSALVQLLDSHYQPLLDSEKDRIKYKINIDSLLPLLAIHRDTGIGKIYLLKDSMYYPIIATVADSNQTMGYVIRWRRLSATPQTIEELSQLMGTKAMFYIGNNDGSLWTDMIKPVSHYTFDTSQVNEVVEYSSSGGKRFITAARYIPNTPWLGSIVFSRQVILESAKRFLGWIIIAGIVLLIAGISLAWIMSHNIIQPLSRLTVTAADIADGNYFSAKGIKRRDEVGKLAHAFNMMIEKVGSARQSLEQKVLETGEMNKQLRNLTAHLQNIREDERMHIAREMHDQLGQLLTAIKMNIAGLKKKLANPEDPAISQKLEDMAALIDESVLFVRKLAAELRPSVLDDFGLVSAMEWHSEEFQKRSNIEVEFHSYVPDLKTSPEVATNLFRIYQESLTNVARHSEATKVTASLLVSPEYIRLSISDNGKGFNIAGNGHKKTLGLLGMKERATMIGGKLEINSEPGKGTNIMITVPL